VRSKASSDGEVGRSGACDACLRRSWLVARLAGRIELARHERRRLREILALSDDKLLEGVAGDARAAVAAELEELDPGDLRGAFAAAELDAVCRHAAVYPARLLDLSDAPATVWVAGGRDRLAELVGGNLEDGPRAVAVVGTRRASAEGMEVARALGRGLAVAGVTVVSGMALGIDSAAHAGALEGGGRTVAVLAGGADVAYPRSKAALHRDIARDGCVVSEMPPGAAPFRWSFPARNRTIAALAHVTVVVEAAARSGSLITAEFAADLGREVGAVPGPVLSWRADGTNALLRDGATLVRGTRDVLDAAVGVDAMGPDGVRHAPLEPGLASVLAAVAGGADTVARLAVRPDDAERALAALTELELLGRVRRAAGGRYVVVGS
jgi:DNA processing protein